MGCDSIAYFFSVISLSEKLIIEKVQKWIRLYFNPSTFLVPICERNLNGLNGR